MAKQYSISEARSSLPTIVDQAEAGEQVELTRRGKVVAVVLSLREVERLRGERTPLRDAYQHFLANHRLSEVGLDKDDLASTRAATVGRPVAL